MEINNIDKLVKIVTENILGKIDVKIESVINAKSCLIIIPNMILGFGEYLEYILKNYKEYDLYIGTLEDYAKAYQLENRKNIHCVKFDMSNKEFIRLVDAVETILILGLKINQMKDVTETNDSEDVNHIILSRIMANKSITIMINSNDYMARKMSDLVKKIRDMGIKVTNIQISNSSSKEMEPLITESHVMKLKNSGIKTLVLDRKQIVTPLAKDKLSEYKIKIEYIKEDK